MPSEVRYHKSAENIDDAECATVKPLSVTYRRFTVLERALMVALSVFIVLAIVFGILYATSDTSETARNKHNGMWINEEILFNFNFFYKIRKYKMESCQLATLRT